MADTEWSNDLHAVSAGDPDALQRLILCCHVSLRAAVAAALANDLRHRLDADDVLQEAYAKAFRALGQLPATRTDPPPVTFDNLGHFSKWLEAIALNQLRDMQDALRRQKRDVAREAAHALAVPASDSYPRLIDQLAATEPTPSRQVARAEAVAAVMSSLARLPEEQREVLRLRFLRDVPFEEIAAGLGKSVDATYMICHRGLKTLRGLLVSITQYLTHL
jgi:RNA polymerase sigma-70 factor (ECF subfamily)